MHFSELRTSAICESKNWLIIKVVPQVADLRNLPRERDTFSVSCLPQEFLPRCISFQEGFVNLTFIVFFIVVVHYLCCVSVIFGARASFLSSYSKGFSTLL